MRSFRQAGGGIDVAPPPKEATVISIEFAPEEIELAFATDGESIRDKVLMALVIAMINDPISD